MFIEESKEEEYGTTLCGSTYSAKGHNGGEHC